MRPPHITRGSTPFARVYLFLQSHGSVDFRFHNISLFGSSHITSRIKRDSILAWVLVNVFTNRAMVDWTSRREEGCGVSSPVVVVPWCLIAPDIPAVVKHLKGPRSGYSCACHRVGVIPPRSPLHLRSYTASTYLEEDATNPKALQIT